MFYTNVEFDFYYKFIRVGSRCSNLDDNVKVVDLSEYD